MEEFYYSNDPMAAPYVQYSQPASQFDAVSDLNHSIEFYYISLHRVFMNSVPTQQGMQLWIRLCLG